MTRLTCDSCGGFRDTTLDTVDGLPVLRWWQEVRHSRCVECIRDPQRGVQAGREARDAGIAVANVHVNDDWKLAVDEAIDKFAAGGEHFTSDSITAVCGIAPNGSSGAMGGRFNAAVKQGRIREVGTTRSTRAAGHARRLTVWAGT